MMLRKSTTKALFSTSNKKATPKTGYKMPKLEEGETIIGFRPYGNTSLNTKTKNFNFLLQEKIFEKRKFRIVMGMVLATFIPYLIFLSNAE